MAEGVGAGLDGVLTLLEILPEAGIRCAFGKQLRFQPFLRFYGNNLTPFSMPCEDFVSTLLGILLAVKLSGRVSDEEFAFQPFLRFYGVFGGLPLRAHGRRRVSTLLEILPLMLGGFPGF